MPPLSADRATLHRLGGNHFEEPVAASQMIYTGAIVARNAAGFLVRGATATGLVGVGVALERCDNSAGAAGAVTAKYMRGTARFANSASGDLITIADIGTRCFIVDDQTVARTNGSSTRSPAGIVEDVDALGVWVRFDEALTRAAA